MQDGANASGFHWPGLGGTIGEGVWDFHDCVSHNNKNNGVQVWQNTAENHHPQRFSSYFVGYRR